MGSRLLGPLWPHPGGLHRGSRGDRDHARGRSSPVVLVGTRRGAWLVLGHASHQGLTLGCGATLQRQPGGGRPGWGVCDWNSNAPPRARPLQVDVQLRRAPVGSSKECVGRSAHVTEHPHGSNRHPRRCSGVVACIDHPCRCCRRSVCRSDRGRTACRAGRLRCPGPRPRPGSPASWRRCSTVLRTQKALLEEAIRIRRQVESDPVVPVPAHQAWDAGPSQCLAPWLSFPELGITTCLPEFNGRYWSCNWRAIDGEELASYGSSPLLMMSSMLKRARYDLPGGPRQ